MIRQKVKIFFFVLTLLISILFFCFVSIYTKEQEVSKLKKDRFDFYSMIIEREENHLDFNYIVNRHIVTDASQFKSALKPFIALNTFENVKQIRTKVLSDFFSDSKQYVILDVQREQFTDFFDTIDLSLNLFNRVLNASELSLEVLMLNIEAINAYYGYTQDEHGKYTIKVTPNKQKALNILYSEKYTILNKEIQNNVTEITSVIETLLDEYIVEKRAEQELLYMITTAVLSLIVLMILWGVYYANNYIVKPITKLLSWTNQIKEGDYLIKHSTTAEDEIGILMSSFHQMSSKIKKDVTTLEQISLTDQLTKLKNRRALDMKLDELYSNYQRYETQFSIILIDIDYFKSVNDTYGHDIGDSVLIEFANILQSNIRETDFVGRWGGEEFLVICSSTNEHEVKNVAEKLRVSIETYTFATVGHKTASFGTAQISTNMTLNQLIEKADKALYHSKQNGRNRVT